MRNAAWTDVLLVLCGGPKIGWHTTALPLTSRLMNSALLHWSADWRCLHRHGQPVVLVTQLKDTIAEQLTKLRQLGLGVANGWDVAFRTVRLALDEMIERGDGEL